jgi:hypothetical protein
MGTVYFIVNAVLYLSLAALCTCRHGQTSRGSGFVVLDNSGHSEYLVIYGGLQLGLGLFYGMLARQPEYAPLGAVFSLLLYLPIVLYRLGTWLIYRPTSVVTRGTTVLEILLLVWAFIIWRSLSI